MGNRDKDWEALNNKLISQGRKAWEQLPGEKLTEFNSFMLWANRGGSIKESAALASGDPYWKESYGSINPQTWSMRSSKWFWKYRKFEYEKSEASKIVGNFEESKNNKIDERFKDAQRYRDSQKIATSQAYEAILTAFPKIINRIKTINPDDMSDRDAINAMKVVVDCLLKTNEAAATFLGIDEVVQYLMIGDEDED
jgi:hypothetical protein